MMAEALTRLSRSPATSGFVHSRSVWQVSVAPAPLRAPPGKGHVFVFASLPARSLGLLWKQVNAMSEQHRQAVASFPLSSEIPCPSKEGPGTRPMGVALLHPDAYTRGRVTSGATKCEIAGNSGRIVVLMSQNSAFGKRLLKSAERLREGTFLSAGAPALVSV